MKAITEKVTCDDTNAWGGINKNVTHQSFEIKSNDIDKAITGYHGNYQPYIFKPSDVGKVITKISSATDTAYCYWYFS